MAEHHHPSETIKSYLPDRAPSPGQALAIAALLPIGGVLFCLAGLILAGTLLGLAVATPLFIFFSPVIVPAVLTIALAVTGILTSSMFGITALSSVSWLINYLRRIRGSLPEQFDPVKQRVGDTAAYMGQKTQDIMRHEAVLAND